MIAHPHADERGTTTVQYVVATGFSLVLLVLVANLLVGLYVRAAVRDAVDEGARAGAVTTVPEATCARAADEVLGSLVRGAAGRSIEVRCDAAGGWVRAEAHVRVRAWLPGQPDWRFVVRAAARSRA